MKFIAIVFLAAAVSAQQTSPAIEVVGPAANPSLALNEQLRKGEDRFVLFDVNFAIREATVDMQSWWGVLESDRGEVLAVLLAAMGAHLDAMPGDEAKRLGNVAAVAAQFFEPAGDVDGARRAELDEVLAGGAGTLRFLAGTRSHGWRDAVPRGGYAADVNDVLFLPAVFRATAYLRAYEQAWSDSERRAWQRAAAAVTSTELAASLGEAEAIQRILFGASWSLPGIPGPIAMPDDAWLRSRRDPAGPWQPLRALFAGVSGAGRACVRNDVLDLTHALARQPVADPVLAAIDASEWRAKWLDAAAFAYVGLREIDVGMRPLGRSPLTDPPRVIVEPVPEVWAVLRRLQHRLMSAYYVDDDEPQPEASYLDVVIDALTIQQRGEELPDELQRRLLDILLGHYDSCDLLLGTESAIPGLSGRFRRAEPQFVRIPVRWRGHVVKALALRLHAEHQDAAGGEWRSPRWEGSSR